MLFKIEIEQIKAVKKFPKKTRSTACFFSLRNNTVIMARATPAPRANIFPQKPPYVNSSMKNRIIPLKMIHMTRTSSLFIFSFSRKYPKIIT